MPYKVYIFQLGIFKGIFHHFELIVPNHMGHMVNVSSTPVQDRC